MAATTVGSNAVVIYGLASEMLSPAAKPVGSLFIVDAGPGQGLEYSVGTDGEWFKRNQIGINGAGESAVSTITESALSGTLQTQTASALNATPQRLTFNPPIRGAILEVVGGNGAVDDDEAALVCFGAPNAGVGVAWLDEANAAPRICMKSADGVKGWYFGGAEVSAVDLVAKGTTPDLDVTVTGVV